MHISFQSSPLGEHPHSSQHCQSPNFLRFLFAYSFRSQLTNQENLLCYNCTWFVFVLFVKTIGLVQINHPLQTWTWLQITSGCFQNPNPLKNMSLSLFLSFFIILSLFWLPWVFFAACQLFSRCGEQGLLSSCGAQASHFNGFSCGAQALGRLGFSSCGYGLSCPGMWGLSSRTRGRILFPCIGRRILNHWTTREALQRP